MRTMLSALSYSFWPIILSWPNILKKKNFKCYCFILIQDHITTLVSSTSEQIAKSPRGEYTASVSTS
jgi:hypothetical protein